MMLMMRTAGLLALMAAATMAQQPKISVEGGNLMFRDNTNVVALQSVGDVTKRIMTRSAEGTSVSLGKMSAGDMPTVTLSMEDCNGMGALEATFIKTGNSVEILMKSSSGANEESETEELASSLTFFGSSVDNGLGYALSLEFEPSGTVCPTVQWTIVVKSTTGDFDPQFQVPDERTQLNVLSIATDATVREYTDGSIAALSSQVAAQQELQSAVQASLSTELGSAQSLITQLTQLAQSMTNCHASGQILDDQGRCVSTVPRCGPTTGLVFIGDPVPGTVAKGVCPSGQYDASGGTTCLLNGDWSSFTPRCVPCPGGCAACSSGSNCTACVSTSSTPRLEHGRCVGNTGQSRTSPLRDCMEGKMQGFPNGVYWIRSARGRLYNSYCLNEPGLGWTQVGGGGWEILHVQTGGYSTPTPRVSNYNLRRSPNRANYTLMPDLRGSARAGHFSQMSRAWAERANQTGLDWIKFSTKIQGNSVRSQDRTYMDFGNASNFNMLWFFTSSGSRCRRMPGRMRVSINEVNVGHTSFAVIDTNSKGLSSTQDTCSQRTADYINTQATRTHGFYRIDHDGSDNSIRHLISYSDRATGTSASRCTYCCWGCSGWRETVVWGVRPHQPESTSPRR